MNTEQIGRMERGSKDEKDVHNAIGLRDTEKSDCGRNDQDDSKELPLSRRKVEASYGMGFATRT